MSIKSVEPFLLGGISSCNAEFFTFPVDLVKTRLQIQGQNSSLPTNKYRGMFDCFRVILKEEGTRALFSGIKPALLRQATYGTLKLGFYQYLKKKSGANKEQSFSKNVMIGMISGATANGLANPTDVLKVRMQTNREHFKNKRMFESFFEIYKTEGLSGLYRGVYPNAQRAAIITGSELAAYDSAKQFLIRSLMMPDNTATHFMSSAIAGLCGAIAATPLDVIKSRIMTQQKLINGSSKDEIYKGSIDCLIKTVKNEGPCALYKGFLPSYLRLGPWNVIFFMTYEHFKF